MDSPADENEMAPTEGTILALLDFLVDPLLPARTSSRETISPSQEELVAIQVHAVVLLYNYYHRKRYPSLPFLEFHPFCKLALVQKPSLQLFFRLMQRTDYDELDDPENHLSLTEKAIMNACDTAKSLDASNNEIIDDWPVNKVAVFLVDSRKENCYLFHGSVTQGVWSAIEKEVGVPSQGSEAATDSRFADKKKRVLKKAPKENQTTDAAGLLQLAYLAVKEKCGINQWDLKVLEHHLVYSTSKPKTAVRLYIMQCMQASSDSNLVPINDVIDSLQGPLVKKESISWIFTPVVEYFHLLPYADNVSNWLTSGCDSCREMSPNSSEYNEATKEGEKCNNFHERVESDSSYHAEAVKKFENGACPHSNEKLLNVSEQNCSVFHATEEPVLNISKRKCTNHHFNKEPFLNNIESLEKTTKVRNGSSCHLKNESISCAPKFTEPSEGRNSSSSDLEKSPPSTSQQFVAVNKESEAAEEIKMSKSCYLETKTLPNASQPVEALGKFQDISSIQRIGELRPCTSQDPEIVRDNTLRKVESKEPIVYKKRKRSQKSSRFIRNPVSKTSIAPMEYPRQEEGQVTATSSSNNKNINEPSMICSPTGGKNKILPPGNRLHGQELMILAQETDQTALTGGPVVMVNLPITSSMEPKDVKALSDNRISDTTMSDSDETHDRAIVSFDPNYKHLRKTQVTIDSKEKLISQTALKNLYRKRAQLSLQRRSIDDQISLYDRSIETILSGGEDDLSVKLDSILEGCNEICLKTASADEDRTVLHYEDQDLSPKLKRKRLSEANLCAQSPCQELDGICNENFWILPTYSISASEGGFLASVTVKGVDFEYSIDGTISATPCEARNSAASKMLTKLRSMAAES